MHEQRLAQSAGPLQICLKLSLALKVTVGCGGSRLCNSATGRPLLLHLGGGRPFSWSTLTASIHFFTLKNHQGCAGKLSGQRHRDTLYINTCPFQDLEGLVKTSRYIGHLHPQSHP